MCRWTSTAWTSTSTPTPTGAGASAPASASTCRTFSPRRRGTGSFSERCTAAHAAVAPMLRSRHARQLANFAAWSNRFGMPLTTSESWASWYYFDSSDLDWGWLLEWAEWSVEDAIEFGMWGWTPHNYVQPQFANWQDVRWHRRLTNDSCEVEKLRG